MPFSVLSWNILGPATRDVADFGFIQGDYGRLGKSLQVVSEIDADIVCFQEVDLTSLHLFNNFLLADYLQASYHEKGAHGGVVVYVKKSKFKVVSAVSSMLKNSASDAPGAFAGAVVENIETAKSLFVASVHMSKSSHREAISEGLYQVADLCNQLGKNVASSIILAGDFNTMYDDMRADLTPYMSEILAQKIVIFEHDSCTADSSTGEFKSIDHILYAGLSIDMQRSCAISEKYAHSRAQYLAKENIVPIHKKLPSDHAPIFAVLE
jgi:endonuclease/exonuclease/phosphatase family metal-dependent hydrolase